MPTFNSLTYFDYTVFAIFLLFFLHGLWTGGTRQMTGLVALVGAYFLAGRYTTTIIPYTRQYIENPKITFLLGFGLLVILVSAAFTIIGKIMQRFVQPTHPSLADRVVGLFVSAAKAFFVSSLLFMAMGSMLSTTNNLLRHSATSPYLKIGANIFRTWIQDQRLQQDFIQREPAIRTTPLPREPQKKQQAKIKL
ncbi:CvpA family protein [Desulfobulbus rhabdoformis]|jgi:uncharacterized membrane protein required for colicin V production|uniref:CvpA family protein n=1 Tax=Desulfobulbus rhabdoformis TaxID=34032 RepID=UPI0019665C56|nr:CvpA family protein [Desulfobulbus rhabdoformis]MBM9615145.1 CvpA family protein [Desulfobulbus rhabdoformis]